MTIITIHPRPRSQFNEPSRINRCFPFCSNGQPYLWPICQINAPINSEVFVTWYVCRSTASTAHADSSYLIASPITRAIHARVYLTGLPLQFDCILKQEGVCDKSVRVSSPVQSCTGDLNCQVYPSVYGPLYTSTRTIK